VKGYILIDPSTDQIIIEHNFQFEESILHAPQEPHADTLFLPPVRDDESAHSDSTSDLSFNIESKYLEDTDAQLEHSDAKSVHADEETEQIPKWAQSTLQDASDLVEDPTNTRRTRSQFEDPPHVLTTTEPMLPLHCYMVQSSDPQTYREDVGNPSRKKPCRRSTILSWRTRLGIWFHFLQT
jgi:hypothetical protein